MPSPNVREEFGVRHPSNRQRALCVDLDGTLVTTDLLWETYLSAGRRDPRVFFQTVGWLLRGRAHLKRRLAERADVDFATLPYREEVLAVLAAAQAEGRTIALTTASDALVAAGVAEHLKLFDEVHASDGETNLKGRVKAERLVQRFGDRGFDYMGDSVADEPIWTVAVAAFTTGARPSSVPHLQAVPVAAPKGLSTLVRLAKALRPHQWVKNLLLFVPVLAAHRFAWPDLLAAAVAFACVCLIASGGYVLNDLLDLTSDRRHPRKRARPFAAGHVSIPAGLMIVGSAWALGFGVAALLLPPAFVAILAAYLAGSVSYSVWLKREPILDVIFLAGLYVVRVVAGGVATGVPVSTWLLAFTLFVCLSLAFLKRFIELLAHGSDVELPGRGYNAGDVVWMQSAGLISAYLSVVVLAIYVNNPEVTRLYVHPERLLLLCPVILYWATRTWFLAARRRLHDDPVVALAADRVTPVIAALSILVLYYAK